MAAFDIFSLDSMSFLSPVFVAFIIIITVLIYQRRRPAGFPLGPPALPVLGSIPFMKHGAHELYLECCRLGKKYGSIFSISFGHIWVVILNDFDVMKEALVTKGIEFAGRATDPRADFLYWNLPIRGIIEGDYSPEWVRQRHTTVCIMRDFGWGKQSIERKMKEEREMLVKILYETEGHPFDPANLINTCVTNIICLMLFGETFSHDNEKLTQVQKHIDDLIHTSNKSVEFDYLPIIQTFVPGLQKYINQFKSGCNGINEFIAEQIKERRKGIHISEPRDFMESYLNEVHAFKTGKTSKISEDWLQEIGINMFIAGSETTSTTLKWALIYMLHYPNVQSQVQKELDEVFGKPAEGAMSSLADRERLPYTDATIMEVQRFSAMVPMALIHQTTAPVKIRGYHIPQGTQVRYNLYNVLRGSTHWQAADAFKPERFLGEDGKIMKKEHWIPFGMGRRNCLGEQLARQELFMLFTAIMHAFTLKVPEGSPLPSLEPEHSGVILVPHKFKVIFEPRQ